MEFTLFWESEYATHEELFFLERIDTWRDIFPGEMVDTVKSLEEGDIYKEFFESGVIVAPYKENNIFKFSKKSFQGINFDNKNNNFFIGRFYQQGIAWKIFNCFKGNREPFRIIEINDDFMIADINHPLAKFPLSVEVKIIEKLIDREERGGECNHIAEIITKDGPGFQIPHPHKTTDFYNSYPFTKINNEKDTIFYNQPRFVNHLDDFAIKKVKSIFSRFLQPNTKILDLMSSWVSHLPTIFEKNKIVGLGLNNEELRYNKNLSDYVIHDLNLNFQLPFIENEFDAVICTSSIEYLIQPIEVTKEVVRILKPEGVFITTISDRWFNGKEILIWSDLHAFERLGFVLDLYLKCGNFKNLKTETIRGFPRPYNDKHIKLKTISDPIFAVSGIVNK